MKGLIFLIQIVLVLLITLSAISVNGNLFSITSDENSNIWLREAGPEGIRNYNPLEGLSFSEYSDKRLLNLVFESLVTLNPQNTPIPQLVLSWNTIDRVNYVFTLRNDVYWHDNVKLTTNDIAFTFDRVCDPEDSSMVVNFFTYLDTKNPYRIISDTEIEIHLKQTSNFLKALSYLKIMPKHAYLNVENNCRAENGTYTFPNDPRHYKPIGTGPLMFQSYQEKGKIAITKFVRNSKANGGPGYYIHDAFISGYEYYSVSNQDTRVQMLLNDEVDQIIYDYVRSNELIPQFFLKYNYAVYKRILPYIGSIDFQCDPSNGDYGNASFRDLSQYPNYLANFEWQMEDFGQKYGNKTIGYGYKVRQALNYALDKNLVMQECNSFAIRTYNPLSAYPEYYQTAVNNYDFSINRANQLLAEAGFGADKSAPERSLLQFVITCYGNGENKLIAEIAQKQWETALGIKISAIDNISDPFIFEIKLENRNYDIAIYQFYLGINDRVEPNLYNCYSSDQIILNQAPYTIDDQGIWQWNSNSNLNPFGQNFVSYWNPLTDSILNKPTTERIELTYSDYLTIQNELVTDCAQVYLYNLVSLTVSKSEIHGYSAISFFDPWTYSGIHNIQLREAPSSNNLQLDNSFTLILSLLSANAAICSIAWYEQRIKSRK